MLLDYSPQYGVSCVIVEPEDDAETVIDYARRHGAVRNVDGEEFCVQLLAREVDLYVENDRPQELYTEEALRRSMR